MDRRSSKRKTTRKSYTVDAFEGIEELQSDISSDRSPPAASQDDEEEEFDIHAVHEAEANEDDDEAMSGLEEASDAASDAGERDIDDRMSIAEDPEEANEGMSRRTISKANVARTRPIADDRTYVRGVPDGIANHHSKDARRLFFFGPSWADYEPVYKTRLKWGYEPCLPSRKEDTNGFGGLHHSFSQDDVQRQRELAEGCKWYHENGGRKVFTECQAFTTLSAYQAKEYMPSSQGAGLSLLMGPAQTPKLFKLPAGQSISLVEAWQDETAETALQSPPDYKPGFILNLGARVHCLEWLPGQQGSSQFLAISVWPEKEGTPLEVPTAPAFTPQIPHKSSIQIWEMHTNPDGYVNVDIVPVLRFVLCTSWGDVKAMKWCPVPDTPENRGEQQEDENLLGLLAGIWTDGGMRVLKIPRPSMTETDYIHADGAAFQSHPPNTVFTCLTWLSGDRLAAGCANGCVAIYDLSDLSSYSTPLLNARPKIFSSIASGYILSIVVAGPSHAQVLLTSSIDGFLRLTDLSRPNLASHATTVQSSRQRSGQSILVWHDFAQCALGTDDNGNMRGYPLRRFFATVSLARFKSQITAVAVSPCHPFVLAGGANGEVSGTNPVRRVVDGKAGIWQQPWFMHEWRRPSAEEASGTDDRGVGPNGLTRISEGYKVERAMLSNIEGGSFNNKDGVLVSTIYEKKSAITALAWNPNLHVGGWAAAGMGNGLVRIEDIAA